MKVTDKEKSIRKFLKKWINKDYVIGAIATGSFVTKYYSRNSDIDIYIILSNEVDWRERGNVVIDDVLIEYFANPIKQIRKYFEKEFENNKKHTARMFAMGKVLYDKNGVVEQLKRKAKEWLAKPFKDMSEVEIEISKYKIWDLLDELRSVYQRHAFNFDLVYFNLLREILEIYSKFLKIEVPSLSKIDRYFEDYEFRREYLYIDFPDKCFVQLFLDCLKVKDEKEKLKKAEEVCKHVLSMMGGFDINGWKLRSKLTV